MDSKNSFTYVISSDERTNDGIIQEAQKIIV